MSGLDNTSYTVRTVAATTTLTNTDSLLVVAAPTANVTVNLPAVATTQPGRMYMIKRDATATFTVTLDGNASETINGATTAAVGAAGTAGSLVVVSDGTQWHIVANA
jgi:hypothetical protein